MIRRNFKRQLLTATIGAVIGSASTLGNFAYAQNNDGAVSGLVREGGSGILVGAQITIINKETGASRTVTAGTGGRYRFSRLPIGNYQIRARKEGFDSVLVENVRVTIGAVTNVDVDLSTGSLEEVVVVADRGSHRIDLTSSESGMTINSAELEFLPVGRSLESVALLAPGAVGGSSAFGGVSFGGASVGENAVFINGLNVSDVETGIDAASAPYAFYEEFQVKTGGYSVEYGRTTGGVVNAVVKRGTNEFQFGAESYYSPDSLRGTGEDSYNRNGQRIFHSSDDESDSWSTSLYVSGPIIQDKLFFFALYEPRNNEQVSYNSSGDTRSESKDDSGFWGGRLDWLIAENHSLELVAFSDKGEEETDRFVDDVFNDTAVEETGGENAIATYTGYFGNNLMARALYGHSETRYVTDNTTGLECNRVYDNRADEEIGCTTDSRFDGRLNSRDALRLDFEYAVGDHLIRFGLDNETRTTEMSRLTTGPDEVYYSIYGINPGDEVNGAVVQGDAYVVARTRNSIGTFDQDTSAYYLEDIWSLNSEMTLTLGLRFDEFDTKDAAGNSFLKIDDMISPRAGFAWDINGDGQSKLFANAGRYYFPIANGLAAREGGGTLDVRNYYELAGLETNTTGAGLTNVTPILGDKLGPTEQFGAAGDGLENTEEFVDNDLEASYQDEFILGYERLLNDEWKIGVRGIYRKFHNAIEDMKINVDTASCGNISGWVFANPGRELTLTRDCGNGPERVTIDLGEAQDFDVNGNPIGGPEAEREYKALELVLKREWFDNWSMDVSYTLSRSEGNYEGGVNSDTENNIPGWTEAGDNVAYLLGNDGRTPNDRTHAFKLRGAYQVNESLTLAANFSLISGRPINARAQGNPFTENTSYDYNYICVANCNADSNGDRVFERLDKGEYGDTDWVTALNMSAFYRTPLYESDLVLGLEVFNLLNSQSVTGVDEIVRYGMATPNDDFLTPTDYQEPRRVQLSARIDF
ncbi:TonB-dependent receptor [Microbulbifer rhizosphaerae]|uniref:Outer membrane receptor protein involved in Fe transport n=1 Tax=Microbulbifer rhizosphaerae TaxID=1562603 RepID=A0A7W4WBQ9_9GAMM|nr:TonB-dependent receptor [Microbulbifer rhizosphaerae]MBB3061337.1 outer membrane receptor protein involved in Fe transport [Microbulbifer rhizosphaerae]